MIDIRATINTKTNVIEEMNIVKNHGLELTSDDIVFAEITMFSFNEGFCERFEEALLRENLDLQLVDTSGVNVKNISTRNMIYNGHNNEKVSNSKLEFEDMVALMYINCGSYSSIYYYGDMPFQEKFYFNIKYSNLDYDMGYRAYQFASNILNSRCLNSWVFDKYVQELV